MEGFSLLDLEKIRDFILFIFDSNTQDNVYLASIDFPLQWFVNLEGRSNEDILVMKTFMEIYWLNELIRGKKHVVQFWRTERLEWKSVLIQTQLLLL